MGVLVHRLLQALGNGLAHGRGGNVLVGCGSSGTGSGGWGSDLELLNVLLGDATTWTGALDLAERDTLLEGELLGGRAGVGATLEGGLETLTGGLGLLGLGCWGRLLLCGGRGGAGLVGWGLGSVGGLLSSTLLGRGLCSTSILNGKVLKGGDVGTLLDVDTDWL